MSSVDFDRDRTAWGIDGLQRQLEDTKLRLALLQYQYSQDEAWQSARDSLAPGAPEIAEEERFFTRTESKTLRLIKRQARRQARPEYAGRKPGLLAVLAALIILLTISLGTALAVSPALRVQVMRLLYTITPEYTEVRFSPDPDSSFEIPAEWSGLYFPTFLPEGYIFAEAAATKSVKQAVFVKDDNRHLRFSEYELGVETNINTEGLEVREIRPHGASGLIASKEGYSLLLWPMSEKYLILDITENTDIATQIAESVLRTK